MGAVIRIGHNHSHDNRFDGDFIRPEREENVESYYFEWNQESCDLLGEPSRRSMRSSVRSLQGLTHIKEEIPSHSKAQRIIDPVSAESDEGRRNRYVAYHLSCWKVLDAAKLQQS